MFLTNAFQPFFPRCCRRAIKNTLHGHLGVSLVSVNTPANKCDCFGKVYRFVFFNGCELSWLNFFFFVNFQANLFSFINFSPPGWCSVCGGLGDTVR